MSNTLIKFSFVMLFFALTIPFDLLAQESGMPLDPERTTEEEIPTENETVREGGMVILDKDDAKSTRKTSVSPPESSIKRESLKPSIKKEEPKSEATSVEQDEDESVLSFNFLYYLIQKFKFNAVE
jgi:hypothetical protein